MRQRNCCTILLLTLLATSLLAPELSAQEKPKQLINVAVLDINLDGMPESYKLPLSNRLRHELHETRHFNVIERSRMNDILGEQGLQMSGCTTADCAVQAGQLLGVERMVAGSVGLVGKTYTVFVRLIDVETGEIVETANADCSCDIDVVLSSTLAQVAAMLSGQEATERGPQRKLSPALPRSAFVPGLGQLSGGRPLMGTTYLVAGVGSLGFLGYSFVNFNGKVSEYNDARAAYDAATTQAEIQQTYEERVAASDAADEAQSQLIMAAGVAGGVYVLNLLDGLIFHPLGGGGNQYASLDSPSRFAFTALPDGNGGAAPGVSLCFHLELARRFGR